MNYDLAYAAYNRTLPNDIRDGIHYGSMDRYIAIKTQYVAASQQKRCHEIVQSLCAWRLAPYSNALRHTMLSMLSHALVQSRHTALTAFYTINSGDSSPVAVMAPPIRTI